MAITVMCLGCTNEFGYEPLMFHGREWFGQKYCDPCVEESYTKGSLGRPPNRCVEECQSLARVRPRSQRALIIMPSCALPCMKFYSVGKIYRVTGTPPGGFVL
jgi:hypothetical protein